MRMTEADIALRKMVEDRRLTIQNDAASDIQMIAAIDAIGHAIDAETRTLIDATYDPDDYARAFWSADTKTEHPTSLVAPAVALFTDTRSRRYKHKNGFHVAEFTGFAPDVTAAIYLLDLLMVHGITKWESEKQEATEGIDDRVARFVTRQNYLRAYADKEWQIVTESASERTRRANRDRALRRAIIAKRDLVSQFVASLDVKS